MAKQKKKAVKKTAPKAAQKPAKKSTQKAGAKAAKPTKKAASKKAAPTKSAPKATATKKTAKSAAPKKTAAAAKTKSQSTAPAKGSSSRGIGAFTPLDDRVLIEREGVSDRTPGGLYIPDTVSQSDRPNSGRVLAVGRGHRDKKGRIRPLDVQIGDKVMYANFAGSEIRLNEQDYVILREDEIIAIVKP